MKEVANLNKVDKVNICEGINLTIINAEKFKTNLVSVYIKRPLCREEVTKNSLLPELLKSGSSTYKSQREISNELDNMYGSSIYCDVSKKGENHVISFKLVLTNDNYLEESIFVNGLSFLNEMISNPLIENGGFKSEYLNIEKNNLKDRIESRINDKSRYSLERCMEEMFEGENFSIYEYGYVEDLKDINEQNLYEHYKNVLNSSEIDIVIVGDYEKESLVKCVRQIFKFERAEILKINRENDIKEEREVKNIEDKMNVTQGKLVLGYRTNVDYSHIDYYKMMVCSSILGGGPHSKLFINVREKESLCYYVYSMIEKYKSVMIISSGIEIENFEKAKELISLELKKITMGEISDEEIKNSKNSLINSIKGISDSINGLSDFNYGQSISKSDETLDTIIEKIQKVSIEDVVSVSSNIKLDTIYFLRN